MKNDLLMTEKIMRELGATIDKTLPGMGFALILFHFNDVGVGNYISNANRDDIVKALRETANRLENNEVMPAVEGTYAQ